MALYSWFRHNNKPIQKELAIEHCLNNQITDNKSLTRYTMWPTAKVIHGEKVIPPPQSKLSTNTETKKHTNTTPTCTVLTGIHSRNF